MWNCLKKALMPLLKKGAIKNTPIYVKIKLN